MPFEKSSDRIVLSGLRIYARIGINPEEQGVEQPVVLDIELLMADLGQAAQTESIGDTLNYERVAELARNTVLTRHYPLVETLAYTLAEGLLSFSRVRAAKVRAQKELAIPDAKGAGAEIVLHVDDRPEQPAPLSRPAFGHVGNKEAIVIVGGGVGGLSTLLWCYRLGHPALLLEGDAKLGGQLHAVYRPMPDLPGIAPITGQVLYNRLCQQMKSYPARWAQGRVVGVEVLDSGVRLELSDGDILSTSVLVVATGVRRRQLGVPGERDFHGRGILGTASHKDISFEGKRAAVVGGGDAACENALHIAETAEHVTLYCRGERLRARREYVRAVLEHARITPRFGSEVLAFVGDQRLLAVDVKSKAGVQRIPVDIALVRIGWIPASEAFPRRWLDEQGFVRTERGLFVLGESRCLAVGDIRAPSAPAVSTAMGDGACAAKQAMSFLEQMEG